MEENLGTVVMVIMQKVFLRSCTWLEVTLRPLGLVKAALGPDLGRALGNTCQWEEALSAEMRGCTSLVFVSSTILGPSISPRYTQPCSAFMAAEC